MGILSPAQLTTVKRLVLGLSFVPLAITLGLVNAPRVLAQVPPQAPAINKRLKRPVPDATSLQGGVSAVENNLKLNRDDTAGNSISVSLPGGSTIPNFIDTPLMSGRAKSEQVPPEVFRAWLSKAHPELSGNVAAESDIVEVAGQWDNAAKTLTKLDLPFEHIKSRNIDEAMLAHAKVLVINCAGEVKRDKLQLVRDFVGRGGYLLTTDWALDNMLVQTFPGYVEWNKAVNHSPIYDADYVKPDPVLGANCVSHAHWKLDESAHLVRVLKPGTVKVLVTSRELAAEDPDHSGVLACGFAFGRGYVLHMVGHFDNNAKIAVGNFLPDPAPNIGISLRQAIAANFIVAGLEGRRLF